MLKILSIAGGLAGAAGLSQYPEFSQQYAQRLGGAVDALSEVVADFDASAVSEGLTRPQALEQMQGTNFIERRRLDMERTFYRHAVLSEDLKLLKDAGPFTRAYNATRFRDGDVANAAWEAYEPAVPLNLTGAIFAGFGFLAGWISIGAVLAVVRWPFRRRAA